MRLTRHLYDAPGFGVGEIWVSEGTVVHHELASALLRGGEAPVAAAVAGAAGGVGGAGPALSSTPSLSPHGGARLPAQTLPGEVSRVCADFVPDLCRRFVAHLSGTPTDYDGIPIDLEWTTPLQRRLAAAAREIPWGEVVSYGELAALAGRPRAARAAGSFCAENRFSLIIPCHRVVAANGIGGYGSAGPELKRRLLALEGVAL